jgi:hypothetical protein
LTDFERDARHFCMFICVQGFVIYVVMCLCSCYMLLYEFDVLIMLYCSVARLRSCSLAMGVWCVLSRGTGVLFVVCCSFRVSFWMFCSMLCLVSRSSDFERGVRYFCNAMVSAAKCYCAFV